MQVNIAHINYDVVAKVIKPQVHHYAPTTSRDHTSVYYKELLHIADMTSYDGRLR